MTETVTQEPVPKELSDEPSDIDCKAIGLFDKVYSTQWNGHDPSMKELHEIPKTLQLKSPDDDFGAKRILHGYWQPSKKEWPMLRK